MLPTIRAIPKLCGLAILDNNIFHNLYISETCILYKLVRVCCRYEVIVIYDVSAQNQNDLER